MEKDIREELDEQFAIKIPLGERCLKCEGTGNQMYFMYQMCTDCNGTGKIT